MKELKELDLSFNSLTDVSFLKELKSLSILDLSHNTVSDVTFLKDLKGLSNLDLEHNKLTDISFIGEINIRQNINLAYNQIKRIPDWLIHTSEDIIINNKYEKNCVNLYGNPIDIEYKKLRLRELALNANGQVFFDPTSTYLIRFYNKDHWEYLNVIDEKIYINPNFATKMNKFQAQGAIGEAKKFNSVTTEIILFVDALNDYQPK